MKNIPKRKLLLIGCVTLCVLLVLVSTSYALFIYSATGSNQNTLGGGKLSLDYADVSEVSVVNSFPVTDEVGLISSTPFNFSVSGYAVGSYVIEYQIKAILGDDVEGKTRLSDDYIRLSLEDSNGKSLYLGTPSSLSEGTVLGTFNIVSSNTINVARQDYVLRAWVSDSLMISDTDSNAVYSLSEYSNTYFSVKIEIDGYAVKNANAPSLDDGMIPIKYNEELHQWVKADINNTNNDWYNYYDKVWANVVLVTNESRDNYLSSDTPIGTPITESDILAYFVWIPRYKYKLFNVSTDATVDPQEIQIDFENGTETTGVGSNVGEYLTHPAFTFGEDELKGVWVAKFETSSSTLDAISTTCRNSASIENCNNTNILPSILPNVNSLRYQQVANQYITSLKFAGGTLTDGVVEFAGSTTYGLTQNTDSHMMKNTEWGAVAYLSHSKYGINYEIYINNAQNFITGRSGGNVGGSVISTTVEGTTKYTPTGYYTYDGKCATTTSAVSTLTECANTTSFLNDITKGTRASTTGNIYGVYDMSGGSWEYVMGAFRYDDSYIYSGYTIANNYNSGYKGYMGQNNTLYEAGTDLPNSKYYDLYGASRTSRILGDATSETSHWYGDYPYWISVDSPWFLRSGDSFNGTYAGVFNFGNNDGRLSAHSSFRVVLAH